MPTTEAEQVIDRYVATWDRGDVDELLDYFTESAVWHTMPMRPAVGKPAIRALVSEWLRTAPRGEVHRQVSDGKTVMHERTVPICAPVPRTERAHRTRAPNDTR